MHIFHDEYLLILIVEQNCVGISAVTLYAFRILSSLIFTQSAIQPLSLSLCENMTSSPNRKYLVVLQRRASAIDNICRNLIDEVWHAMPARYYAIVVCLSVAPSLNRSRIPIPASVSAKLNFSSKRNLGSRTETGRDNIRNFSFTFSRSPASPIAFPSQQGWSFCLRAV